MSTLTRTQRKYDHRLRELVQTISSIDVAVQRGVPRSTAYGWLSKAQTEIVTLDVFDKDAVKLQHEYRLVPTGTLARLAERLGKGFASPSTWYRLVRTHKWRRPRRRVHPAKPKVGIRASRVNGIWHVDSNLIRLSQRQPCVLACSDRQLLSPDSGLARLRPLRTDSTAIHSGHGGPS